MSFEPFFKSSLEDIFIGVSQRERWREMGERDRDGNINVRQFPPTCTQSGGRTCKLGTCPDPGSNPQSFAVQEDAPAHSATQPGQFRTISKVKIMTFRPANVQIYSKTIRYKWLTKLGYFLMRMKQKQHPHILFCFVSFASGSIISRHINALNNTQPVSLLKSDDNMSLCCG